MDANQIIDGCVTEIGNDIIALRRTIHEHPELAFEEVKTAALVSETLTNLGIEHRTGIAGTGVIGHIKGSGPGKTVAIRADMDALPTEESNDLPFASKVPGKMHGCGHDAHTAILLGIATVLNRLRHDFRGQVKLIFQPAEETLQGARAMIDAGILEEDPKIDVILGYHNWPPLEAGKVGFHPDACFGAFDAFDVTLKGISGHAAHPHRAIDVITIAAHFVTQVQTAVNREIVPVFPCVVSIGQVQAGTSRSILPDAIHLKGGARAHDPEVLVQVEQILRRILEGLKVGLRIDYDLDYQKIVPMVRNDKATIARVIEASRSILGADNVVELGEASLGGEDLSLFTNRFPSAHLRIGSSVDGLETMLHRANYQCNELAIPTAIRAISRAAFDLLS
jgi:amidohydrolase